MNTSAQELDYIARINRVQDYIQANLDKTLSLKELSGVANFSPFHFHRLFRAIVGETVTGYMQRLKVERAASLLKGNPRLTITEVALDSGFSSSAAFARLFRDHFNMSASQWRVLRSAGKSKNGETKSKNGKASVPSIKYADDGKNTGGAARVMPKAFIKTRRASAMSVFKDIPVNVKEMDVMTVAYVRHIGPYQGDTKLFERLWGKLMTWAGPRGFLQQAEVKCLCVYQDDPEVASEKNLRLSVCVSVPQDAQVGGEIGKMSIPAGTYAYAHFEIGGHEFQKAWDYMFGEWLPRSGYQPDDRPSYELCLNNPAEHPQHKHSIDIYLPVKPL